MSEISTPYVNVEEVESDSDEEVEVDVEGGQSLSEQFEALIDSDLAKEPRNAIFWEVIRKQIDAIAELTDKNKKLEKNAVTARLELKNANNDVLKLHKTMTVHGALAYFEKRAWTKIPFRFVGNFVDRYKHIFDHHEEFRENLKKTFKRNINRELLCSLIHRIFENPRVNVRSVCLSKGVIINGAVLNRKERNLIVAVCLTLPCSYTIVKL